MNNKTRSKLIDTFMEEEGEKCKIFRKRPSVILAAEKKFFCVKVRRKSVNSENVLESLSPPSRISAYATGSK